ncbi:MAG: lipopolysaccharide heptosyltransferase II, partial [Victivallales bacterium]|nr:lipopolysaccharide heptosyltransferase II [Victivallales bacterium]
LPNLAPIMKYVPNIPAIPEREPFQLKWRNGLLLRCTNWLGDALMTLPAAWQASRALPRACGFFVLCPAALAPLWSACPWVDVVVPMQGRHASGDERNVLRRLAPGVALVFPNSFGSAMDVCRCGIPQKVGRRGRFRGWMLTHTIPEWPRAKGAGDRHQLFYYLELVSSIVKLQPGISYPALKVDLQLAADFGISGKGWLALAPGAAYGPAKQWPMEHFLELAKMQLAQGRRIVFVGTSKEAATTAQLCSQLPGSMDLAGRTNLAQLMAVLSACEAVVANDSGAMHLAAALGTPGVAIFGSTDPVATGPIGAQWRLLVSDKSCRPCFKRTCPLTEGQYSCLAGIKPQDVAQQLEELYKEAEGVR